MEYVRIVKMPNKNKIFSSVKEFERYIKENKKDMI